MYLHLGKSTVIRHDEIVGIFDIENTTVMRSTRDFLSRAQHDGRVVNVSYELPGSFVVCDAGDRETVYISQISPATLKKRATGNKIV